VQNARIRSRGGYAARGFGSFPPHLMRGMERRLAPHLRLSRPLARTPRLPALHRGVFNPGPRFYSGRWTFVRSPFLSQLLAAGLLDPRAEPRGSRSRACEARQRAPHPAPPTERLRKTPLGEPDEATLSGPRRGAALFFSRLELLRDFRARGKQLRAAYRAGFSFSWVGTNPK
jgi:hypothetical protein